MNMKKFIIMVIFVPIVPLVLFAQDWEQKQAKLMTNWATEVGPKNALTEYPRPQLKRTAWMNLNGLWDYDIQNKNSVAIPEIYEGKILVPYPIESALSGVKKSIGPYRYLWYHRTFQVPGSWSDKKVLLHFGAVDWETVVYVNGDSLGMHQGGYDSFSFDITSHLKENDEQDMLIRVFDPSNFGTQPLGKQTTSPGSIWYTSTTGIWQTVWLEPVSDYYVDYLILVPDVDNSKLKISVLADSSADDILTFQATVNDEGDAAGSVNGKVNQEFEIDIANPELWSPENPFLYGLSVVLSYDGIPCDTVQSYFGMRKIEIKTENNVKRIFLNNERIFQVGPLDQGFWPDGLYAAPTDEALKWDIEKTKALGFNMTRKHVKVEPARWYYWTDKLGLLVWQDMPSMPSSKSPTEEAKTQFEVELRQMIQQHWNHPSIVLWVVFNEGWGQHNTVDLTTKVMDLDPSRLVTCASGWTDYNVGHIKDIHSYPNPNAPSINVSRASVLGEFFGFALREEGHMWDSNSWGYVEVDTPEELAINYDTAMERVFWLEENQALNAAVVTQLTDVETEINGLITYDRKVIKAPIDPFYNSNYRMHIQRSEILPTSEEEGQSWKYTRSIPAGNLNQWYMPEYDDSAWDTGVAGFGETGTPGTEGALRTKTWTSGTIYIRKEFEVGPMTADSLQNMKFRIHHDDDVWIYINGVLAGNFNAWTTFYVFKEMTPEGIAAIKPDTTNVIAVRCVDNGAGNYIDVGLVIINLTDVENNQNGDMMPKGFGLSQNYPNPFNPLTTIQYNLLKSGPVRLYVYNLTGERVAVLVDTRQSAGAHTIEFNAANLTSGIYVYQLNTNEFVKSKKMIILK